MTNWQSKMRSTLDDCWQTVYNSSNGNFKRIQKFNDFLNSFIISQATSHLEAWSDLINNESSNHHS